MLKISAYVYVSLGIQTLGPNSKVYFLKGYDMKPTFMNWSNFTLFET